MEIKKTVSKGELMFYLEEVIQMNLADEIEESFFQDCKWYGFKETVRQRMDDLIHIIKNYRTYQKLNF